MKNVEQVDIITQICWGQSAPLIIVLGNCLFHLHTWKYRDMNVLCHWKKAVYEPSHPPHYLSPVFSMKLIRGNDVVTEAYVAWVAERVCETSQTSTGASVRPQQIQGHSYILWRHACYMQNVAFPSVLTFQEGGAQFNCTDVQDFSCCVLRECLEGNEISPSHDGQLSPCGSCC